MNMNLIHTLLNSLNAQSGPNNITSRNPLNPSNNHNPYCSSNINNILSTPQQIQQPVVQPNTFSISQLLQLNQLNQLLASSQQQQQLQQQQCNQIISNQNGFVLVPIAPSINVNNINSINGYNHNSHNNQNNQQQMTLNMQSALNALLSQQQQVNNDDVALPLVLGKNVDINQCQVQIAGDQQEQQQHISSISTKNSTTTNTRSAFITEPMVSNVRISNKNTTNDNNTMQIRSSLAPECKVDGKLNVNPMIQSQSISQSMSHSISPSPSSPRSQQLTQQRSFADSSTKSTNPNSNSSSSSSSASSISSNASSSTNTTFSLPNNDELNVRKKDCKINAGNALKSRSPSTDDRDISNNMDVDNINTKDLHDLSLLNDYKEPRSCYCPECGKHFKCKYNLISHRKMYHSNGKANTFPSCPYCDHGNLRQHIRTHTNERPFKCSHCDKAFKQKHSLNDHMRIHTGERPYKCNVCFKSFSIKHNMQIHKRIHTGEKPYVCTICNTSYRSKSGQNSHMKNTHPMVWETIKNQQK